MSVLIFLGILFLLVLVHELGHFAVAKWTGMRVDEFGIGFPPKLFGIKRGETEYTFNLFPIGGFVKIAGEDGVLEGTDRAVTTDTRFFTAKSKWAQAGVLLAGVTMNVLLAWLLFTIAFSVGVRSAVSEADATDQAMLTITSVLPESPAADAGIPPGAVVTKVSAPEEELSALTPSAFSDFVAAHQGTELTVAYRTQGGEQTTLLTPESGLISSDTNRAAIGVALAQVEVVRRPVGQAILDAGVHTLLSIKEITVGIGRLAYDSVRGNADFSQVAGPVGIVGLVGEASAYGLTTLLTFTAFISLNLAVINILPFPALDGGRLLFVCIEAIKRSPINPRYAATLNTVGFVLLLLLMVAVTWNDIARLV